MCTTNNARHFSCYASLLRNNWKLGEEKLLQLVDEKQGKNRISHQTGKNLRKSRHASVSRDIDTRKLSSKPMCILLAVVFCEWVSAASVVIIIKDWQEMNGRLVLLLYTIDACAWLRNYEYLIVSHSVKCYLQWLMIVKMPYKVTWLKMWMLFW